MGHNQDPYLFEGYNGRVRTALTRRSYSFDVADSADFDAYVVLGITRSATKSQIRAAYVLLAKELHPDRRAGDAEAEKRFKAINYAYHALLLSEKQNANTRRRRFSHPIFVAFCAFIAPFGCLALYVLLFTQAPQPSRKITEIRVAVGDFSQSEPQHTGSIEPAPSVIDNSVRLAATRPLDMPLIDETANAFLNTLRDQQDIAVVSDYLKLDPVSPEAPMVREHLRNLIMASRDRRQLAAFVLGVSQDDHVEAALAVGRLRRLAEEDVNSSESFRWIAAVRGNTKSSFASYLRRYQNGRYTSQARTKIAALQEPRVIAAPDLQKVRTAKDNDAWNAARRENSGASYSTYLAAYPRGRFSNQAQRKIAALSAPAPKPTIAPAPAATRQAAQPSRKTPQWPTADEPLVQR